MNDSQNKRKNDTTSNENENTTSPKDNVDITVTGVAVYAPKKKMVLHHVNQIRNVGKAKLKLKKLSI